MLLSRASELHTGAEIDASFVEALHRGFAEDREPTELDLGAFLSDSVPLAVAMSEEIERLRHRAKARASQATRQESAFNSKANRKLDLS